jgi:cytochrome c oxidase cbb3-type subunit III
MRRALAAALLAFAYAGAFASDIERGREVWNFRCYFCHGYSGDARTLAASYLAPRPRDFQASDPREFPLPRLERGIREGVPGTSMKSFRGILSDKEIAQVAAFLRSEFLEKRAPNTRYHTKEAGWPGHERYADAFPFARGDIALDTDENTLDAAGRRGRKLFLSTCITCHDRGRVNDAGPTWERSAGR